MLMLMLILMLIPSVSTISNLIEIIFSTCGKTLVSKKMLAAHIFYTILVIYLKQKRTIGSLPPKVITTELRDHSETFVC